MLYYFKHYPFVGVYFKYKSNKRNNVHFYFIKKTYLFLNMKKLIIESIFISTVSKLRKINFIH